MDLEWISIDGADVAYGISHNALRNNDILRWNSINFANIQWIPAAEHFSGLNGINFRKLFNQMILIQMLSSAILNSFDLIATDICALTAHDSHHMSGEKKTIS